MSAVVWTPSQPEQTHMWQFMHHVAEKFHLNLNHYQDLYQWSIHKPEQFWSTLCTYFNIKFTTPASQILNNYQHMIEARWFEGATFNFAAHLLQRTDDHPALVCINEAGERHCMSYKDLYEQVAQCAAGLKERGVQIGDRVAAVMPNVSYTIIAMLATTAIGAIWSSCSPDFGLEAIVDRFEQVAPKVLFICNSQTHQGKTYMMAEKIKHLSQYLPSIEQIVICPSLSPLTEISASKTTLWQEFVRQAGDLEFAQLPFNHSIYILFSSGTTGKPKCIVHGAGGTLLQHIKELALHTDIKPHDNMLFYTTCGWMMWNWMVSTLSLGATLTLYEGSPIYPTPWRLFEIIAQEKITVFGTSAKFISSVEQARVYPKQRYDLTALRVILSTGSPLMPNNYDFVYQHIKSDVQLASISGGTDIISCFALGNPILPVYRGELQCIGLGMDVKIFNDQGQSVIEERGELVCTKPFPSMPVGFWLDRENTAYYQAYFAQYPGVWRHGDYAKITQDHGLVIYGRSDATLNPGGVRIGTAEIYRQLEQIPAIIDSIVIDQEWHGDVRVVLFVKLQPGQQLTEALQQEIRITLRTHASPRHVPAKIVQVKDIPRTVNGKTVEVAVRQLVHHQPIHNLQAIANPEALEEFKNRSELMD